jgi:hypothetical protein
MAADAIGAVDRPGLQNLSYLVFDGRKLVAAFARRDDAEQWIEEIGHPTMKLREVSKQGKTAKPNAGDR